MIERVYHGKIENSTGATYDKIFSNLSKRFILEQSFRVFVVYDFFHDNN